MKLNPEMKTILSMSMLLLVAVGSYAQNAWNTNGWAERSNRATGREARRAICMLLMSLALHVAVQGQAQPEPQPIEPHPELPRNQPAFGPQHAVKVDLVGPAIMLRTGFPALFSWKRISVKYEHRIATLPWLSVTADAEYQTRFMVFDNGLGGTPQWDHGFEFPRNLSLIIGAKFAGGVILNPRFMYRVFAEPRVSLEWRHSHLVHHDLANNVSFEENVNRPGIAPRFRAGIDFRFGRHLGLELAGDLTLLRTLGDRRNHIELFPEFCPTVWF